MSKRSLVRYSKNYQLLQEAAETIGKKYQQKAYGELCGGSLDESDGEFEYKGVMVSYSAYSFNVKGGVGGKQWRSYQVPGRVSLPLERGQRSLICLILPERMEKFKPRAVSQFARGARNIRPKIVRGAAQYFLAQRKPSSSSSGAM